MYGRGVFFIWIFTCPVCESKFRKGKIYMVKAPGCSFVAECIMVMEGRLGNIGDDLLMFDTDTDTRQDAIESLREYYPDLKKNSLLTCFWFEKTSLTSYKSENK